MRVLYCTLSVAHCVCLAFVSADGPNPQDPAKALKAYYQDRKALDWQAALTKVAGPEGPERDKAAAWLRAILAQALKDEKSGDAPWEPTPFFGEGPRNPAGELRKAIAKSILDSAPMPGAVPILAWYLEEEYVPLWQEQAAIALGWVKGPAAAKLRAQLAGKPHPNSAVTAMALQQIAMANESLPTEKLAALCQHHHRGIREAARVLNQQLKYAEPPPFNAAQALRSPDVQKLLEDLSALVIDVPPADAPFVVLKTASFAGALEMPAWLLHEDADKVEIITFWGERQLLPKISKSFAITAVKVTLEDEVALVEKLRTDGSSDVKLALQFGTRLRTARERRSPLYELLLAERLHTLGKSDLTTRVLFHALDALDGDAKALQAARQELGMNYGYKMLVAFAGDRDYKATARYADALAKHFPETMFHDYATALSTQLPKRGADFVKLTLPTPEEWETLKKKLTRTSQIDFLCERMRLLNCFQDSQPGDFYAFGQQYAEPCGISSDASFGGRGGKTMVINPLVELGPRTWSIRNQKYTREQQGDLTIKDIPQLSKYLRDDWQIPSVSFFRDFSPSRTLHSTRPIFAELINGLANMDVCQIERWRNFTGAQIDKELERIVAWAKENADKTPLELEWDRLEATIAKGTAWRNVRGLVEDFLDKDQAKALDAMRRYLKSAETDDWEKWSILRTFQKRGLKALTAKDLADKNDDLRISAAILVFQTDKSAKAREVVGNALEQRGLEWWTQDAVDLLLDEGSAESRRQVARLFAHKDLHLQQTAEIAVSTRGDVLRRCADAGMVEPFQYYLKQLENNDLVPVGQGMNETAKVTWADLHVSEILRKFGSGIAAVTKIREKHGTNAERLPELKTWLQGRITELAGGK